MHFLQAINSDISVLIVCNKTGGTIKGDIKKTSLYSNDALLHKHEVMLKEVGVEHRGEMHIRTLDRRE